MSDARLTFGTAGLRAALGDGPQRMNLRTVELAATAIAQWLPAESVVVIGRDARHGSADFANVTARVLVEHGHHPKLFPDPVPTPVVAHAVAVGPAAGGVMVTASHNPATDNGYKVYAGDGSQILPIDAARIEATMAALPWPDEVSAKVPEAIKLLGNTEVEAYLSAISGFGNREISSASTTLQNTAVGLKIAYTAMHGVGGDVFVRALEGAGHTVRSVPEQHDPDPDFPTASFPNPEEPGTMDMVVALADAENADLVLANDPDADRLAVAVKRGVGWERLTGDQIGALLGWFILGQTNGDRAVATTIVSSSMLGKIAAAAGVTCHETLTGFKWLMQTDRPEQPLVFAYEEALGYSVLPTIRDKDGISAGLVFAELVSQIAEHGHTVDDVLDNLYAQHGVHLTSQVSKRFDGDGSMEQMAGRMTWLRANPPTEIAGVAVDVTDLIEGTPELPASDVLTYRGEGVRLIIRPSGTEPKIKAYIEAVAVDQEKADSRRLAVEHVARTLLG